MAAMSGGEVPPQLIRQQVESAIDLVIQLDRLPGGVRKATHVSGVLGEPRGRDVFRYRLLGVDQEGRAHGQFEATGTRPAFLARLEAAGVRLPLNLFDERTLLRD
jgi:pilus assembly protein CpaF